MTALRKNYRSVYKDELRVAMLLLKDIARDDRYASAKASGFLAGIKDRLGWEVSLSDLSVVCPVCSARVETTARGTVADHYATAPDFAIDRNPSYYCRGAGRPIETPIAGGAA